MVGTALGLVPAREAIQASLRLPADEAAARAGVPSNSDREALHDLDCLVAIVARWIGHAGVIKSQPGQRDTEASQAKNALKTHMLRRSIASHRQRY